MNETITVEKVINHALRRCGLTTPTLEPEQIDQAKNNLMFTLLDLNNRGVPIYLVEQLLLGFTPNTWNYTLPRDVYDITTINWRQITKISCIAAGGVDPEFINDNEWFTYGITDDFFTLETGDNDYWIDGYGICFVGNNQVAFTVDVSLDGTVWKTVQTYPLKNYTDGEWIWFDIETPILGNMIRLKLTNGDNLKVRSFQFSSNTTYELTVTRMNRDDFFTQPQKGILGSPWNWYLQKTLDPVLMTWQSLPANQCMNSLYHMYYIKAPIKEELTLPAKLQIPQWYVDAVIWGLAAKIAWELPNIDENKIGVIEQKATNAINQAEASNADLAPINLIGSIMSQYNRLN